MSDEIRAEDDVEAHGPLVGGPTNSGPTNSGPTNSGPTNSAHEDDDADFEAHGPINSVLVENAKNAKNAK